MPMYTDQTDVAASPDSVFRFVSDIANLPKYLPTVHGARGPPRPPPPRPARPRPPSAGSPATPARRCRPTPTWRS